MTTKAPTSYSLIVASKNGQTVKLPFVSDRARDDASYMLRTEGYDVDESPAKFTLYSSGTDALVTARLWCND